MIDLETHLAALVDVAPEAPDVVRVTRRGAQRRSRRRLSAIAVAAVLVAVSVTGAVAASSNRSAHRLNVGGSGPLPVPADQHLRVTMLDGSQLEITGPSGLGLTQLPIAFSASLDTADAPSGSGHTLSVEHDAPAGVGPVVGRYPTHDGHELVVSKTSFGVDAAVQYDNWVLVVTWGPDSTDWAKFASEIDAHETADGYLVLEPVDPGWQVGPADAPDVQLGGTGYGGGASYSFFGPHGFPAGCPTAAQTVTHTPQGWAVTKDDLGTEWCDANEHVRIAASDASTADAAVQGLRVEYTDAAHEVDDVTTLDGSRFEITAPATVLDQLILQASVSVDGLDTPNILNTTPNLLPLSAERAPLPSAASGPAYTTADGHQLFAYTPPTECGCEMLAGTYGPWLVEIEVTGMSATQRSQIASLFAANETADGFLVLDPAPGMHLGPAGGADIVLDRYDVDTAGAQPRVTDREPADHPAESAEVHRLTP